MTTNFESVSTDQQVKLASCGVGVTDKRMKLQRYEKNPIIAPVEGNKWESLVTTNPGAWYDEASGEVKLIYRAAGDDPEHFVRFGLATSKNGYDFTRQPEPVLCPSQDGFDAGCVEDPRIIKIGEWYYVTYASRPFPPGEYWLYENARYFPPTFPEDFPRIYRENATWTGLAMTKDFKTWIRAGRLTNPMIDDRDVIIYPEKINGKYYLLHRPMEWIGEQYGTEHPAIWLSSGDDMLNFGDPKLVATAKYDWECKVGGNTPPIRTDAGWLFLYHAVGPDKHYRLGAILFDLNEPERVLHRTPDWIMQPETSYELEGPYEGCIFPCGAVVIDGTLFVYYGGADKFVGLATCNLAELLDHMKTCPA